MTQVKGYHWTLELASPLPFTGQSFGEEEWGWKSDLN